MSDPYYDPDFDDTPDPDPAFDIESDLARDKTWSLPQRLAALIALLRSDDEIPRPVRLLIADLFDENGTGTFEIKGLKRRRKGRVRWFTRGPEADAHDVDQLAKKLRAEGVKGPKTRAVEEIAKQRGVEPDTIARNCRARKKTGF